MPPSSTPPALDTELASVTSRLQAVEKELNELNKDKANNTEKIAMKQAEKEALNKRKNGLQSEKQNKRS